VIVPLFAAIPMSMSAAPNLMQMAQDVCVLRGLDPWGAHYLPTIGQHMPRWQAVLAELIVTGQVPPP
jgi:hypothetical protein